MTSDHRQHHILHVNYVFRKINEPGFKLSDEKCEYFMPKIKYLIQVIDGNGKKSEPTGASAIKNMLSPTNVPSFQAILG